MGFFIFDDNAREALRRIKAHAEANPFNLDDMFDIMNKAEPPAGDREGFSCIISLIYRIVFSIEEHPQGKSRHLSITLQNGALPHPYIVRGISQELGFIGSLEKCQVYIQNDKIVNIVELIK